MKNFLAFLKFLLLPYRMDNVERETLSDTNFAEVRPKGDRYALIVDGQLVEDYSRKRDAFRGAERRGYEPIYNG